MDSRADGLLSAWQHRRDDLQSLASPLLHSSAVRRLASVTFLGLLSPRFSAVAGHPLWTGSARRIVEDGTRYDHTLGVALVALDLVRQLGLPIRVQRYAVAWGLTHDIATWPLSHTSEPAFGPQTGFSARALRTAMILDASEVPESYRLSRILRDSEVDPVTLAALFDHDAVGPDEELALFKQVVRSPLTPDTLEGIWRCGTAFDIPVPPPGQVLQAFFREGPTVCLDRRGLGLIREFWSSKADIYRRFINREDVIRWESAWSLAIARAFVGISLADSLVIEEEEIVRRVLADGLASSDQPIRYKTPQSYFLAADLRDLPADPPLGELWKILRREPVGHPLP